MFEAPASTIPSSFLPFHPLHNGLKPLRGELVRIRSTASSRVNTPHLVGDNQGNATAFLSNGSLSIAAPRACIERYAAASNLEHTQASNAVPKAAGAVAITCSAQDSQGCRAS